MAEEEILDTSKGMLAAMKNVLIRLEGTASVV
jgi:hypothetical protein